MTLYSIGEISKLTGVTASTLRYDEKAGVLPQIRRSDGIRHYGKQDLRYVRFMHGLKQKGTMLEEVAALSKEDCMVDRLQAASPDYKLEAVLRKRAGKPDEHIGRLGQRMKRLEAVKVIAEETSDYDRARLREQGTTNGRAACGWEGDAANAAVYEASR